MKKRSLYKSVAVFTCIGMLAACAPAKNKVGANTADDTQNAPQNISTLNVQSVLQDGSLSAAQKSERLTQMAEKMVTPTGFIFADKVLNQALSLDGTNKKAQLYSSFLAPMMAFKGILKRIKPLAHAKESSRNHYEQEIAALPESPLKAFLLDGPEDIRNEKNLQAFGGEIYNALNEFRTFLKNNKSFEATLEVNSWDHASVNPQILADCFVRETSEGVYDIRQCGLISTRQYRLNRADIEMIQQATAGMQIYFTTLIAYDFSGSIDVAERLRGQNATRETVYNELIRNADFGKLNNAQAIQNIAALGTDAVAGTRWAIQVNNELCNRGQNNPNGSFLRDTCSESLKNDAEKIEGILRSVEAALGGQTILMRVARQDDTQVKPAAFLQSPIADIKTLAPTFNRCDKLSSVEDGTLGGVFPNDDLNAILQVDAACQ